MKTLRSFAIATIAIAGLFSGPSIAVAQEKMPVHMAQYSYPWSCRAVNGYGSWGIGAGYTIDQACYNAEIYCARNAPVGTVCRRIEWWRSY